MSIAADRARLLESIKAETIVQGWVTLSSGRQADHDVDLRRVTLDGEAAPMVGRVMLAPTSDLGLGAFVVRKAGTAHGLQLRWWPWAARGAGRTAYQLTGPRNGMPRPFVLGST